MLKFIIRGSVLVFILLLLFISGLLIPGEKINENLHFAVFDKKELIQEINTQQRIILVGGSNVSFGFHSPIIEERLNVKVINSALHAGYGLKYILDDVLADVRKGDIVIVFPEYSHFYGDTYFGGSALLDAINVYPENTKLLNLKQLAILVESLPKHALGKIFRYGLNHIVGKKPIDEYHRLAFNSNGDMVGHWGQIGRVIPTSKLKGKYTNYSLDHLEMFNTMLKNKEAICFVSFPSLNQSSFLNNKNAIELIENNLIESELSLLGKAKEYSFNDSLHFNTTYHLKKEGQILRSNMLVNDLLKIDMFANKIESN